MVNDNAKVGALIATGDNIKWYASETSAAALDASTVLIDNTDYWATQTNTENCESVNRLKISVSILSANSPTTTNSTQTFCVSNNPSEPPKIVNSRCLFAFFKNNIYNFQIAPEIIFIFLVISPYIILFISPYIIDNKDSFCLPLHRSHDTQPVATPYLLDVALTIPAL